MTIKYKAVKMNSPLKKEGKKEQYYPRVAGRQKKGLKDIAKSISQASSFSTIDVIGVLEAFTTEIPYFLKDNCSVELGDLGTFSLHVSGEGSDEIEEVNASKIKSVKMAFRPSVRVKKDLKKVDFKKVKK
ncbi:HU family DNA-binding protein [Marinifilum sp.]|uniref:HU family DNA-binding protein n=1 Tax=Marinifilum sp. TaxID=2033137 RepID=UPI003BA86861